MNRTDVRYRNDADDLMQDKTWLQEMKAEIMRRAEASSDEEEDVRYRREARRTIPLDDDFEDFDDSVGDVSVAGDGEVSSSDDEEAKEAVCLFHAIFLALTILLDICRNRPGTRIY